MCKLMTVKEGFDYLIANSGKFSYEGKIECVRKFLAKFPHMPARLYESVNHPVTKEYYYDRYTLLDYDNNYFFRLAVFEHEGKLMINELKIDCFTPKKGITNAIALKLLSKHESAYDGVDKYAEMSDDFRVWQANSEKSSNALSLRRTVEYLLAEEIDDDANNYDYINKKIAELTN